ncbi:cysteine ase inhibitor-like [Olea europaea subsp. europaea]|nr:cysteine ase inhibitor-like [Olea europaea subsp. europaea]
MAATSLEGLEESLEATSRGITPFERIGNNPECVARFAVDEYNKKEDKLVLEFKKVLNAKQQVVVVFVYCLTLEVFDREGQRMKVCEAEVWFKLPNCWELRDFKFVDDA